MFVTALVALVCGWLQDRARLTSRIEILNSTFEPDEYQKAELTIGGSVQNKNEPGDFLNPNRHPLETVVQIENLEACPPWQNDAPNPPVSASEAIGLADAVIPTLAFPGPDGIWQREEATLTPIKQHWCWVVNYRNAENSTLTGGFNIIVLMDGSVLKPRYSGREIQCWF